MEVLNITDEQLIRIDELVNHGISINLIAEQEKVSAESVASYVFDIWRNKSIDNLEKWLMLSSVYNHYGYDIDGTRITKEEYFNILRSQGVLTETKKNKEKVKTRKITKVMSA